MFDWDIDRFPLKTATPTPGQRAADKWLRENPEHEMREVQPGDLDRLTEQHQDDPADRFFGVPTLGGGLAGGSGMNYGSDGYNQPNRSYPGDGPQEPGRGSGDGGYHMPGITHPFDEDEDEDEEYERDPIDYHVVTGPRGSTNQDEWTEHPYTMFENPHMDMDADAAHDAFMEDHHEYDTERNPAATHEVIHVHPAEHHDTWRNQLGSEEDAFSRIAPHGFEREAPDMPGHMSYRHVDPHGGTHRIWHNDTHFVNQPDGDHGPGWRTSYHNPELSHEQQLPWSFHDDNAWGGNSLGDALERADRNKAHADVVHSDTGLRPVENLHGRHYTSRRPDGSTQQLLYNQGRGDGSDNWMLAHYHPQDSEQHTVTYHGADLPGALEQARRNLARG